MADILERETPFVTHDCKAVFISHVADDLSLHSSLFSIIYICPSSTKWKLSPLGYYTPKFLETALRCPLSTDLQSESKECVGCAQTQLQR